ncbi:MAG: DUF4260 domain-containing protein [Anaerolineae bacterium]|jgi:hypothetical protein|nr:DUF4260 domain-containing protein [Anaerolineae bacterium]
MSAQNTPSLPKLMLHVEGGAIFITACVLYAKLGANGWVFAVLFFSFDVFMVGYARNPQFGSLIYNIGHTEAIPLAIALIGLLTNTEAMIGFALIWLGHIGLDRLLGYGLKYPTQFKDSHLQRL